MIFLDHPLFHANTLYLQDATGNPIGLYNYIVDSVVHETSEALEEASSLYVISHEFAHRRFTHQPGHNTFEVIRRLTAISHALLSKLLAIAVGTGSPLRGRSLSALSCDGKTPEIALAAESIIKRIQFIENYIDMGDRGIGIIAEMEALDWGTAAFQGQVEDDIQVTSQGDIRVSKAWLLKTQMFETLIRNYPSDFGGYNVSFGSFQNAARSAWGGYSLIDSYQVRQELLRLCTYILYLNEDNSIQVLDPIKLIIENASFCCHNEEEALAALSAHRQQLDLQSKTLIDTFQELLLQGIHDSSEKELVKTLNDLVVKQLEGSMYLGSDTALQSAHWSSTWAFLHYFFHQDYGYYRVHFIWPYIAHFTPKGGWKYLLFYESLRQSLKAGSIFICPLRGWKTASMGIRSIVTPDEVKCTEQCAIRRLMVAISQHSELIQQESFCDVEN